MRVIYALIVVVAFASLTISFCAAAPVSPPNPCFAGNQQPAGSCTPPSPAPTATPADGRACNATPSSRFASQLVVAGTTEGANCLPNEQLTLVDYGGKACTSPQCTTANLNLYAAIVENQTMGFTVSSALIKCRGNYPYTAPGCRPILYSNVAKIHADEAYGFFNARACPNPSFTRKIYGTPTNPAPPSSPAGEAGDSHWHEASRVHVQGFSDAAHAYYWTSGDGCQTIGTVTLSGPSPVAPFETFTTTINGTPESYVPTTSGQTLTNVATFLTTVINGASIPGCTATSASAVITVTCTPTLNTITASASGLNTATALIANPASTYMADEGDSHVTNWWASFYSGTTVAGVTAGSAGGTSGFDQWFGFERDTSENNIGNQLQSKGSPSNTSGATCTQEWGCSDTTMVDHRIANMDADIHRVAGTALTGTGYALMWNGLATGLNATNTCELGTREFNSPNALMGQLEQAIIGFAAHVPETRQWIHEANCISTTLATTDGDVFFQDHETPAAAIADNYQEYYNHIAFYFLVQSPMRIVNRLSLEDAPSYAPLTVYRGQQLVPAPGDGFPSMAAFMPTSCSGCDSSGYDPNAGTDGNWGSGADVHDTTSDHGIVDLAMGSSCSAGLVDYKGHPVCVYFREYDTMYVLDLTLQRLKKISAEYGLSGDNMAFVVNPSTSTITVQCTDLPRHTYHHIVTITPATPAAGTMDVLNGGDLAFSTSFSCGGASAQVPPESSRWYVN